MLPLAAALVLLLAVPVVPAGPAVRSGSPQLRALVNTTFPARVVGVVDGDTIDVLRDGRHQLRVRLDGIDTPERAEPFYQVARNRTRVLAFDRQVSVTGRDIDVYGRLVARVVVDGRDVSVELVAGGLACMYRRYSSDPILARAEAAAKTAGLGFWAKGAQQPPCVPREAAAAEASPRRLTGATAEPSDTRVIGNRSTRVYHKPSCRNATCPNCTRIFVSAAEAARAGFRAAGDCH